MWIYEKKLIYPLGNIRPNPRMAKLLAMLLGGANGELTASLTYLNQRYCMPCPQVAAILSDIGTEELSHVEMLSVMMKKMLADASIEELRAAGMEGWAADHNCCPFPQNQDGYNWTGAYIGVREIPLQTLPTIWQQSKKPAPVMKALCASAMTHRCWGRFSSCESARSYTISALGKH